MTHMSTSKIAAIEFLKEQLATAEGEHRKIRAVMARLPQLDAEIQAIKLLLAKHTGEKEVDRAVPSTPSTLYPAQSGSVTSLAHRALREAGKPQKTEQLLSFLASHGKETSSATLRSAILNNAKRGRLFRVVGPGIYGLLDSQ